MLRRRQVTPQIELMEGSDLAVVRVFGKLDENFGAPLQITPRVVFIDLQHLSNINSPGIRSWLTLVRDLELQGKQLLFVNCAAFFIELANNLSGLLGQGQVLSLRAPYFCRYCGEDRDVLLDCVYHHHDISVSHPPAADCQFCGLPMAFNEIPGSFFDVVSAQAPPKCAPAHVGALRDAGVITGPNPGSPTRVRKAVSEDLTLIQVQGIVDRVFAARPFDDLQGSVIVDLRGVTRITEDGRGRFVDALQAAFLSAARLWIVGASPTVCRVFAQRRELVPLRERIAALRAPYRCRRCLEMLSIELWIHEMWPTLATRTPPSLFCPRCGRKMVSRFDESFLRVLPLSRPEPLDPRAAIAAQDPERFLREATGIGPRRARREPRRLAQVSEEVSSPILKKYVIEDQLGRGRMGQVLLGRLIGSAGFEKRVVIKRILPQTEERTLHLVEESRVAAQLSHPNIVQVYDLGRERDQFFIVMEHVDGLDLSAAIRRSRRRDRPIPVSIAVRVVHDVLLGLHHAHRKVNSSGEPLAVIHRDVSPRNIIVSRNGVPKLVNFGITTWARRSSTTDPGQSQGRFIYMAPEQVTGLHLDHRVDIYGAGAVLYELLFMSPLFRSGSQGELLYAVVNTAPPKLEELPRPIPTELYEIMVSALSKDRDERYRDALGFAQALEAFSRRHQHGLVSTSEVGAWATDLCLSFAEDSDTLKLRVDREPPAPVELSAEVDETDRLPIPSSGAPKNSSNN